MVGKKLFLKRVQHPCSVLLTLRRNDSLSISQGGSVTVEQVCTTVIGVEESNQTKLLTIKETLGNWFSRDTASR